MRQGSFLARKNLLVSKFVTTTEKAHSRQTISMKRHSESEGEFRRRQQSRTFFDLVREDIRSGGGQERDDGSNQRRFRFPAVQGQNTRVPFQTYRGSYSLSYHGMSAAFRGTGTVALGPERIRLEGVIEITRALNQIEKLNELETRYDYVLEQIEDRIRQFSDVDIRVAELDLQRRKALNHQNVQALLSLRSNPRKLYMSEAKLDQCIAERLIVRHRDGRVTTADKALQILPIPFSLMPTRTNVSDVVTAKINRRTDMDAKYIGPFPKHVAEWIMTSVCVKAEDGSWKSPQGTGCIFGKNNEAKNPRVPRSREATPKDFAYFVQRKHAVENATVRREAARMAAWDKRCWKIEAWRELASASVMSKKAELEKTVLEKLASEQSKMEKAVIHKLQKDKKRMENQALKKLASDQSALEQAAFEKLSSGDFSGLQENTQRWMK